MMNKKSTSIKAPEQLDMGILPDLVGYNLHVAEIYSYRGFVKAMSNPKTTAKQFPCLVVIEANPGISQTSLGDSLSMDRATTMAVLDSLQQSKLLLRKQSTVDKRKHALFLSAKGVTTIEKLKKRALQYEEKITPNLTKKEIEQFKDMLRKVQLGALSE
jgi:DNA-binding MarR family transcriptional regulator